MTIETLFYLTTMPIAALILSFFVHLDTRRMMARIMAENRERDAHS
ncbi:hypothetical protein [Fulvimarina sp. MAC8]